jgi:hypothetical protein
MPIHLHLVLVKHVRPQSALTNLEVDSRPSTFTSPLPKTTMLQKIQIYSKRFPSGRKPSLLSVRRPTTGNSITISSNISPTNSPTNPSSQPAVQSSFDCALFSRNNSSKVRSRIGRHTIMQNESKSLYVYKRSSPSSSDITTTSPKRNPTIWYAAFKSIWVVTARF